MLGHLNHPFLYKNVLFKLVLKIIKQRKYRDNIMDNEEPDDQFPSDIFHDIDNFILPKETKEGDIDKRYYQENPELHGKKASKNASIKNIGLRNPININYTALWGLVFLEQCLLKEALEFKEPQNTESSMTTLIEFSNTTQGIYTFMCHVIKSHNYMDYTKGEVDSNGFNEDFIYEDFCKYITPIYTPLFNKHSNQLKKHIIDIFFQFIIAVAYSAESNVWNNSISKTYSIIHLYNYMDDMRRSLDCSVKHNLFNVMRSYAINYEKQQIKYEQNAVSEKTIMDDMDILVNLEKRSRDKLRIIMNQRFDKADESENKKISLLNNQPGKPLINGNDNPSNNESVYLSEFE